MANKPKIQYIRYYTPGSEAIKLEPVQPARTGQAVRHKAPRPAPKPVKALVIALDPVAILATCVAIIMVVLMGVGMSRLNAAQNRREDMAAYVEALKEENQSLTQEFEAGYSAEAVEKAARSLGMIPIEEARTVKVEMDTPEPPAEEEPSLLDKLGIFLTGLLA